MNDELITLLLGIVSMGMKYQSAALTLMREVEITGGVSRDFIDSVLDQLDEHKAEWESLLPINPDQ